MASRVSFMDALRVAANTKEAPSEWYGLSPPVFPWPAAANLVNPATLEAPKDSNMNLFPRPNLDLPSLSTASLPMPSQQAPSPRKRRQCGPETPRKCRSESSFGIYGGAADTAAHLADIRVACLTNLITTAVDMAENKAGNNPEAGHKPETPISCDTAQCGIFGTVRQRGSPRQRRLPCANASTTKSASGTYGNAKSGNARKAGNARQPPPRSPSFEAPRSALTPRTPALPPPGRGSPSCTVSAPPPLRVNFPPWSPPSPASAPSPSSASSAPSSAAAASPKLLVLPGSALFPSARVPAPPSPSPRASICTAQANIPCPPHAELRLSPAHAANVAVLDSRLDRIDRLDRFDRFGSVDCVDRVNGENQAWDRIETEMLSPLDASPSTRGGQLASSGIDTVRSGERGQQELDSDLACDKQQNLPAVCRNAVRPPPAAPLEETKRVPQKTEKKRDHEIESGPSDENPSLFEILQWETDLILSVSPTARPPQSTADGGSPPLPLTPPSTPLAGKTAADLGRSELRGARTVQICDGGSANGGNLSVFEELLREFGVGDAEQAAWADEAEDVEDAEGAEWAETALADEARVCVLAEKLEEEEQVSMVDECIFESIQDMSDEGMEMEGMADETAGNPAGESAGWGWKLTSEPEQQRKQKHGNDEAQKAQQQAPWIHKYLSAPSLVDATGSGASSGAPGSAHGSARSSPDDSALTPASAHGSAHGSQSGPAGGFAQLWSEAWAEDASADLPGLAEKCGFWS